MQTHRKGGSENCRSADDHILGRTPLVRALKEQRPVIKSSADENANSRCALEHTLAEIRALLSRFDFSIRFYGRFSDGRDCVSNRGFRRIGEKYGHVEIERCY